MAQEIYHRSNWGIASNEWGSTYLNSDLTNELYKRAGYYENSWATDKILNKIGTKPSIILTPTAYGDGVLNSVKPKGGENLLPYSEDFSEWNLGSGTSIESGYTAPDGSNTAYKVTGGGGALTFSSISNQTQSRTIWARTVSGTGEAHLCSYFGNTNNLFTITNKWQRFEVNGTTTPTGSASFYAVDFRGSSTLTEIIIWGAQLERGSEATEYIKTNGTAYKNGDFSFTRGSSATRVNEKGLIQDVQILSDELVQNGDFEQIGSELVTNGGFDTDSDWNNEGAASFSIANGVLNCFSDGSYAGISQNIVLEQGKTYKLELDIVRIGENSGSLNLGDQTSHILLGIVDANDNLGKKTIYFTPQITTTIIRIYRSTACDIDLDNVSVKEVGQNWSFGTGWSIAEINGKQVAEFDGGADAAIQQGSLLTSGKKYRLSIDVANKTTGSLQIRFGNTGVVDETITTNGTFTYDLISDGTTLYLRSIGGFDGSIDNVSVIEITDDTDLPRIDYTDGEGSLLLEPQSTNLVTYSEDFSQSYWTKNAISVSSDVLASPNGTVSASKITENSTINNHRIAVLGLTGSGTHTISVFAKANDRNWLLIRNSGSNAWFDVLNGVVGTVQNGSGSIENYGNGWYRCSVSMSSLSTPAVGIAENNGSYSYQGNGEGSLYIWGFQVEQQSFPTSYIPTNGTTVTRLADEANNAGNSDLINSTEGVLYAEISGLKNYTSNRYLSISDGTYQNQVWIKIGGNDFLYVGVKSNNTTQYSRFYPRASGYISENYNKIAVHYKQNDFFVYLNGNKILEETSGSTPIGMNKLSFDNGSGFSDFYGNVKCVAVFKEALSDEELHKLTSL